MTRSSRTVAGGQSHRPACCTLYIPVGERVLIIDDDKKLAQMLVEYLAGHGFAAFSCGDES